MVGGLIEFPFGESHISTAAVPQQTISFSKMFRMKFENLYVNQLIRRPNFSLAIQSAAQYMETAVCEERQFESDAGRTAREIQCTARATGSFPP